MSTCPPGYDFSPCVLSMSTTSPLPSVSSRGRATSYTPSTAGSHNRHSERTTIFIGSHL